MSQVDIQLFPSASGRESRRGDQLAASRKANGRRTDNIQKGGFASTWISRGSLSSCGWCWLERTAQQKEKLGDGAVGLSGVWRRPSSGRIG
jgi:hypothetical protein